MSFRFFQSAHYQRSKFIKKAKEAAHKLWIVVVQSSGSPENWNAFLDSVFGVNNRNLHHNDFNNYIGSTNFNDGTSMSISMFEISHWFSSWKDKTKKVTHSWFSFEIGYDKNYFSSLVKIEDTYHKFKLIIHWGYLIGLILPTLLFIDHVIYYWYPSTFMVQFFLYPLVLAAIFIIFTSRKHRRRENTQLEDTIFEWDFDVITQYPIFARQILTPDIMNKINLRVKTSNRKIKPTIIFRSSICEIQFDISRYSWIWFFSHSYTPYIKHLEEVYHAALALKKVVDEDIISRLWDTNYTDLYYYHKNDFKRTTIN